MSEITKNNKAVFKKWWFWLIVVLVVIALAGGASQTQIQNQATETEKTTSANSASDNNNTKNEKGAQKPRLTLDDGWKLKKDQFMTEVVGTVSNNSDEAIDGYIQITFSALDSSGANVGDCLANANTVDAKGKWKFKAFCSGEDIDKVRFKEITGF
ncbi:hypothetical protein CR969_00660 [Candidatus Saccharibacteria bacterium]|nr:MAG: hypothetical protein CR969_00660 [Candidatus Saccharibacteria bacterium]